MNYKNITKTNTALLSILEISSKSGQVILKKKIGKDHLLAEGNDSRQKVAVKADKNTSYLYCS